MQEGLLLIAQMFLLQTSADARAKQNRIERLWKIIFGAHFNAAHDTFDFVEGGVTHATRIRFLASGLRFAVAGREYALEGERLADGSLLLRLDGRAFKARALRDGDEWHVLCGGDSRRLALAGVAAHEEDTSMGSLAAPMSGRIVKVLTQAGAKVAKGDALLILEAMKMEHTIAAPKDGVVKEIHFAAGEQVPEGAELVALE